MIYFIIILYYSYIIAILFLCIWYFRAVFIITNVYYLTFLTPLNGKFKTCKFGTIGQSWIKRMVLWHSSIYLFQFFSASENSPNAIMWDIFSSKLKELFLKFILFNNSSWFFFRVCCMSIWFLWQISRIHLHGKRNQIYIQKQSLANDRFMLVFFRRTFLLIFLRKVNFKVVVCAVKENLAEQSLRILCSFSPHISGNKKPGLESHWKWDRRHIQSFRYFLNEAAFFLCPSNFHTSADKFLFSFYPVVISMPYAPPDKVLCSTIIIQRIKNFFNKKMPCEDIKFSNKIKVF